MDDFVIIIYDNYIDMEETISQQLRNRRLALRLCLAEVARRAGTSIPTLSRYEKGWNRFELYTLQKLASALGCKLSLVLRPLREVGSLPLSDEQVVSRLRPLFWDRHLNRTHLKDYPKWVLRRVLDYGSLEDVRLLMAHMGRESFLTLVSQVSFQSAKTQRFWKNILERKEKTCTKRFSEKRA